MIDKTFQSASLVHPRWFQKYIHFRTGETAENIKILRVSESDNYKIIYTIQSPSLKAEEIAKMLGWHEQELILSRDELRKVIEYVLRGKSW